MWPVHRQFLDEEGINAIDWPFCSPDLNLTKQPWDVMHQWIRCHRVPPQKFEKLSDALIQVWEEIPQDIIHWLIRSRPRCFWDWYRYVGGLHTTESHYELDQQCFTCIFSEILNPAFSGLGFGFSLTTVTSFCTQQSKQSTSVKLFNLNNSFLKIWCVFKVFP